VTGTPRRGPARAKRAPAAAGPHAGDASPRAPRTLAEFMAQALAMEIEAARRYAEFADAMDTHNNRDVAELFRKMAAIESRHAEQIMASMGWASPPPETGALAWRGADPPESPPADDVHYLMQPYHALQLALAAEKRAARFFGDLARVATVDAVREAALQMQAEEREHVELVKAWLRKVPRPPSDWAHDPDPPRFMD
jgi:rubrerythrin